MKGYVKMGAFILAIILLIFGIFACFKLVATRKAISAETKVTNYYENIKVSERTRVDTLQALAESVKSHAKLEEHIFTTIAEARKNAENGDFDAVETNITTAFNAIAEAYPTLRSTELYAQYNDAVATCNNNIQTARKAYNTSLRDYNNLIRDPFWNFFISKTSYEKVEFPILSETLGNNQDMPNVNLDWADETM